MNKSVKSATTLLLGLAILLVAYFGVYQMWTGLAESRTLEQVSKAENDRLNKALADIQAFVSQYNTNSSRAETANKALPVGDPDTAVLLDYYSRMVKDSGLALIDLSIQDDLRTAGVAAEPGSIQSVDWDIQASGSFESFKDFLLRVKNGLRLTDVVSVGLDNADDVNQDGRTLRLSIKLRTYYQK